MKRRIKKIRTMILCDSVYDLRLLNKVKRVTFFFFFNEISEYFIDQRSRA
jgi:hypothetical protein